MASEKVTPGGQIMRWSMFVFCCCVVAGIIGWCISLLFTDPWIGQRMLPMGILLSLPNGMLGVFWLGRAKRWW